MVAYIYACSYIQTHFHRRKVYLVGTHRYTILTSYTSTVKVLGYDLHCDEALRSLSVSLTKAGMKKIPQGDYERWD